MTVNITDADTFTTTVVAPADGDAVTGASIVQPVQDLADRTYFLKQRYDEFTVAYAVYEFGDGTAIASGSNQPLTLKAQAGGYSMTSNEIEVPAAGLYFVSFTGLMTASSAASYPAGVSARLITSASIAAVYGECISGRTDQDGSYFSATGVLDITNTSTEKIEVVSAVPSGNVTIQAGVSFLQIRRFA